MHTGFLRLGAENGVAASDIGNYRMGAACMITQFDFVFFARTAAVLVTRAGRQKTAEYTVLRVEDREMLIRHGLDQVRSGIECKVSHLSGVQIVRRSQA